jgi:predicted RNase H-like HicB family nuclease
MNYRVLLIESDGGFAVSCPTFTGCWSQGKTEAEALEMIADAITGLLDAGAVPAKDGGAEDEAEIIREAGKDHAHVTVREVRLPVVA